MSYSGPIAICLDCLIALYHRCSFVSWLPVCNDLSRTRCHSTVFLSTAVPKSHSYVLSCVEVLDRAGRRSNGTVRNAFEKDPISAPFQHINHPVVQLLRLQIFNSMIHDNVRLIFENILVSHISQSIRVFLLNDHILSSEPMVLICMLTFLTTWPNRQSRFHLALCKYLCTIYLNTCYYVNSPINTQLVYPDAMNTLKS